MADSETAFGRPSFPRKKIIPVVGDTEYEEKKGYNLEVVDKILRPLTT